VHANQRKLRADLLSSNFSPALESWLDLLVEISGSGGVLPAPGWLQVSRLFA
jgi:hypothetical protein